MQRRTIKERLLIGVTLACLVSGAALLYLSSAHVSDVEASSPRATLPPLTPLAASPVASPTATPTSLPIVIPAAPPLQLQVPAIDVNVPVKPYTIAEAKQGTDGGGSSCYQDGRIVCIDPQSREAVSWQVGGVGGVSHGAMPGTDSTDNVYLFQHSFTSGQGLFNNLYKLKAGDKALIKTKNGVLTYVVQGQVQPSKDGYTSESVVRNQVPGRLLLVTCYHGPKAKYVGGHSVDNTVVVLQLQQ